MLDLAKVFQFKALNWRSRWKMTVSVTDLANAHANFAPPPLGAVLERLLVPGRFELTAKDRRSDKQLHPKTPWRPLVVRVFIFGNKILGESMGVCR